MNVIHKALVSDLNISTYPCAPVRLLDASGRTLAFCHRKVHLTLANTPSDQEFLVAPIGVHPMILGMPWLETANPVIDWKRRYIRLSDDNVSDVAAETSNQCNTNGDLGIPGNKPSDYITESYDRADSHINCQSPDPRIDPQFVSRQEYPQELDPNSGLTADGPTSAGNSSETSPSDQPHDPHAKRRRDRPSSRKGKKKRCHPSSTNLSPLSTANLAPLPSKTLPKRAPATWVGLTRRICKDDLVYVLYMDSAMPLHEYFLSISDSNPSPTIPAEYEDLADVFSEEKANTLPPLRGTLDHMIPLEEGSKPTFGPIYNLSETELKVLREYLDENLQKGFIRPSTSPFGSPVLFVKKPDGSLRLVVDYRALNRITVKNRYPLPLISEMLDRLVGAKYFTKLDARNAYNTLRIAPGEEYKTAFRTRYGHFEYLVMPFGLTNAPASFQSFINDVLRKYLDTFVIVFLDDILVYTNGTLQEHISQVRLVLQELLANGIHCKAEKCEFHAQKISFLGYIVSTEGISMDPDRVATIAEWPVPQSVHDIRVFLGFANFYRRFIEGYSKITLPITLLLRKARSFKWNPAAQDAFEQLKKAFTSGPILRHFDPMLPIVLHADSSGFALSGILSQPHDGHLHPVAFWSRKCSAAELNYDIFDREALAIVESMKHWRHYLEGSQHPIQIRTDHKNLETFMTTKILNRRQARWAEFLADYDFVLLPIPGTKNPADGPSRRPDYADDVELPSGSVIPKSALRFIAPETPVASVSSISCHNITAVDAISLRQKFIDALVHDPIAIAQRNAQLPWSWDDGLLLRDNLIYVPDRNDLRLELLRMHHDDPLAGHFGIAKTLELLSRNYWFPRMRSLVQSYVSTCDLCARSKPSRHVPHGELAPLPVPSGPWKSVSCDFIVDLPTSRDFNAILTVVDRFTKMAHFIPCTTNADAPDFARMFLDHVVRLHGLPDSLVSDRGSIFTSRFWSSLASSLGIHRRLSTAFHPQTDGQTERMNQVVEQYLRIYCNHQQDNWSHLLSVAEFAVNNSFQASLKCSPFYANYGYHPTFSIDLRKSSLVVPAAKAFAESLRNLHDHLLENLKHAQDMQAHYYDANHKYIEFTPGDKVWLLSTNIKTQRPSKKLD